MDLASKYRVAGQIGVYYGWFAGVEIVERGEDLSYPLLPGFYVEKGTGGAGSLQKSRHRAWNFAL